MSGQRVLVITPTYDERESLPVTLARLRAAVPDADVLVVDDGSPDGTGEIADAIAVSDPAVHVLHRPRKSGLGGAYTAGFTWGLQRGYDVLVEMDADGSHAPEQLPSLLAAVGVPGDDAGRRGAAGADLALGSRWVPGGRVVDWPLTRQLLSRAGSIWARWATGAPLHDATGGFRAYRAHALRAIDLPSVRSEGYCYQIDLATRVVRAGLRVVEVPITFTERAAGASKMSRAIVVEALWRTTVWGAQRRTDQARTAAGVVVLRAQKALAHVRERRRAGPSR
ncbi:dolichol-phosphate mannosyltransferase [Quadrisphaera granulorum]|uniref:Dolichol-phosphate mannosyltransferase n=1 Tax=Quadrisphaera granulorum TaxID=317664 RepID=A0A316A686_9ACTN|nr:polyprenol monophosphomannose synthase [Quadrisphaera granulorum]PWJ53195.1 dolichol-phosphate mannosyltransferase [Quadrisphaera granulorum]SZE97127.1 dolichol-phosphate mannosyltransferase [Quadrisphaera granulorum]